MSEDDPRLEFRVAVLAVDGRCLLHDDPADCIGRIEVHHVVTQRQLIRAGREDLLWDPCNGIAVCDKGHDRHHLAFERIPRDRIPARCIAFAREYGFERFIERYYPKERTDADCP